MEWFVFISYAVLLVLILLVQPNWPIGNAIRRIDTLHVLMGFKFFYPDPVDGEHIVYYRTLEHNAYSDWTALHFTERDRWSGWLVQSSPHAGVVLRITSFANKKKLHPENGAGYRHLLGYIRHVSPRAAAIQFKVVERQGWNEGREDKILFESPIHYRGE